MRKTSELIWQDAQHQVLFDILEQIKRPGSDREVLCRLKDYTEYHFALEEEYMQQLGFPGREAHVQAHNRFREEIIELLAGIDEPNALDRDIISTFLTEWLTRHVFGIDKALEDFILESNAK